MTNEQFLAAYDLTARITHLRRPQIPRRVAVLKAGAPTLFEPDGLYPEYELRSVLIPRSGRGGETIVTLHDSFGVQVAAGEALCHPNDNFNRKLGRTIATGRAIKQYRASLVGYRYRSPLPEETRDLYNG